MTAHAATGEVRTEFEDNEAWVAIVCTCGMASWASAARIHPEDYLDEPEENERFLISCARTQAELKFDEHQKGNDD